MKLTYQFMQDLLNLLRIEDLNSYFEEMINEIDQELQGLYESSISRGLKEKERLKDIIDKASIKGKYIPTEIEQKQAIKKAVQKPILDLLNIKKPLVDGKYPPEFRVFKDIENAKLLLQHLGFLYSKDLGFNLDSVRAIESMLKENFSRLHNKTVDKGILEPRTVYNDFSMIEELLYGKINNIEDLKEFYIRKHFYYQGAVVPDTFEENTQKMNSTLNTLNIELIRHSYEKLKPFIIWFYPKICYGTWDSCILALASYFSSKEAIDNYLENEVDFESFETIENTIAVCSGSILELTNEERSIWHNLNARYGIESIRLFGQSVDIKNNGFNIVEVANNEETLDDLFSKVKSFIETIRFDREEGHEDLAKILRKYDIEEESFNKILDEVLPNIQNANSLPDVTITTKDGKYTLKKLPSNDYRGFVLGKMTKCCQYIGGDSERCVIDGFTRETAGFYILHDKKEKIKAQCYAWIGTNNEGKRVLILDSFEHLPEAKKYFVELIHELSDKIESQGFAGLYIGTGGKTPQLNANKTEISAADPDLHRYRDSKSLYKITKETKLFDNNDKSYECKYKTFDDMMDDPYYKVLSYIQSMDSKLSEKLNPKSMVLITSARNEISKWLAKDLITPEQIVKLFAVDNPFARNDYTLFPHCDDTVLNDVLKSIDKISNFKELMAILEKERNEYSDRRNIVDTLNDIVAQIEFKEEQKALNTSLKIKETLNIFYYSNPDKDYNLYKDLQQEILDGKISQNMQDVCNEPNITNLIGQYLYGEWYGND